MNEERMILAQLSDIQKQGSEVWLINVYKGFPISFPAKIRSVSDDSALLSVHRYQTVCIRSSRLTYIKNIHLKQPVKAEVTSLDLDYNLAVLKYFQYTSTTIGNRETIRVEPDHPTSVQISNGIISKGELINISIHGVGMYLDQASFAPRAFGVGQKVDLIVRLYPEREVFLKGVVRNVISDEVNIRYRLGIRTFPDANAEVLLSHFIAQRQVKILREIKSMLGENE